MAVPESITGKVTKAQFLAHAVDLNAKETPAGAQAKIDALSASATATYATQAAATATRLAGAPSALVAAGGANVWEPGYRVYNWKASNTRRFRSKAGAANAGFGLCHIVCAGDSTDAGAGATVHKGYPAALRKYLVALGWRDGGPGYVFFNQGTLDSLVDQRLSLDPAYVQNGGGANFFRQVAATGKVATYYGNHAYDDDPVTSTYGEIGYLGLSADFEWSIDDTGVWTAEDSPGSDQRRVININGLTDASHWIKIRTTGTALTYPKYMLLRKATGLLVTNAGNYGARSTTWPGGGTTQFAGDVLAIGPDLTILGALSINGITNGQTVASYKADMATLISVFKGAGDVLLKTSNPINAADYPQDFGPFNRALYELADEYDVPLVDFYERNGTWAQANTAGMMSDAFHPNAAWYADQGRALAAVLSR